MEVRFGEDDRMKMEDAWGSDEDRPHFGGLRTIWRIQGALGFPVRLKPGNISSFKVLVVGSSLSFTLGDADPPSSCDAMWKRKSHLLHGPSGPWAPQTGAAPRLAPPAAPGSRVSGPRWHPLCHGCWQHTR